MCACTLAHLHINIRFASPALARPATLRHLSQHVQVPDLKIVMEHITTADAVDFVASGPAGRLAATITPQHILLNRNSLFQVTPNYRPAPNTA